MASELQPLRETSLFLMFASVSVCRTHAAEGEKKSDLYPLCIRQPLLAMFQISWPQQITLIQSSFKWNTNYFSALTCVSAAAWQFHIMDIDHVGENRGNGSRENNSQQSRGAD